MPYQRYWSSCCMAKFVTKLQKIYRMIQIPHKKVNYKLLLIHKTAHSSTAVFMWMIHSASSRFPLMSVFFHLPGKAILPCSRCTHKPRRSFCPPHLCKFILIGMRNTFLYLYITPQKAFCLIQVRAECRNGQPFLSFFLRLYRYVLRLWLRWKRNRQKDWQQNESQDWQRQ